MSATLLTHGRPWPAGVTRSLVALLRAVAMLLLTFGSFPAAGAESTLDVPILVYHRFGATVADAMTVTTEVFDAQLRLLRGHGYHIVPMRDLVDFLRGTSGQLPPRAVVITVDDDHRSVYSEMFPLIRQYKIPVTLFIYPSAISNASYALTWTQLREMKASGLVDIQSHTYWHPNFAVERRHLAPDAYWQLVRDQLTRARTIIDDRVGGPVNLLAWPFGIYDTDLMQAAVNAGYIAGFSIDRRPVTPAENIMALPRYIVTDRDRGARFEALLSTSIPSPAPTDY